MSQLRSPVLFVALFFLSVQTCFAELAIREFFSRHCVECHGEKKQKGGLNLTSFDSSDREIWRMIAEQIRFRDMPPKVEDQPTDSERAKILRHLLEMDQVRAASDSRLLLPEFGNLVDHDSLFQSPAGPVVPAPPRLWRLRPESYLSLTRRLTKNAESIIQPFSTESKSGIYNYAGGMLIDEPATELLLRNARLVVASQGEDEGLSAIFAVFQSGKSPTMAQISAAIRQEFQLVLRREPDAQELERFLVFWKKNDATSGHPIGTRATLMAVLMMPEALFQFELGSEAVDASGRRRLTQIEIARSISFALRESIDPEIWTAARRNDLATREQVKSQVSRLLAGDNSRVLQFFREYFGYQNALRVFKDPPEQGIHDTELLVSDLEFLIQEILKTDRQVLRELLTTDRAFVNWDHGKPARDDVGYAPVYGLPLDWIWTKNQPVTLPKGQRSGVLTHPAWLVAWSGNFDNDPVRRGKWIRTHLLGGLIPDVPIGVDARVPDAADKTLRERLHSATSATECWRCHRKMDDLGLPLEQYTHLGHFRNHELKKPVVTGGGISRVGDSALDGREVADPFEMLQLLSESERVEQVFVRHAFRFFLGRNETPGDAATLQDAWRAYQENEGSFRALVTSLLISDSFLYRAP